MRSRPVMGRRVAVLAIALGLLGVVSPRQALPATAVGPGDVTPPALNLSLEWTGPETPLHDVILVWDDLLDESLALALGDFDVQYDDADADADPVSLPLDRVEYTHAGFVDPGNAATLMTVFLTDPVTDPGTLTVTYTPSGANPIKDIAGNVAEAAPGVPVEGWEFPDFGVVGAIVDGNYGRNHIGLIFSDAVDPASLPLPSDLAFSVTRNLIPIAPPTSITIFPAFGGRIVDLELPEGFRSGDAATVSYDSVTGGIESLAGTPAPDFPDADVFMALIAQDSIGGATPAGGGNVSTDAGDPGTTAQDPTATSVTVPGVATILIDEGASDYPPSVPEYTFIGETVEIVVSPAATAANPIVIDFAIDASILTAAGVTEQTVQLLRNSVPVPACTGALGTAVPLDPCIESRTAVPAAPDPLEYAVLRVNTSQASVWTFAARDPFPWAGFRAPVNDPPTVNVGLGGLAIPVRFTLGGDQGMAIFAPGYPKSERVACPSGVARDLLEVMLPVGESSLHYGTRTGVYTYIWKTERAWSRAPAGPCRKLTLGFVDGTVHEAIFRFR